MAILIQGASERGRLLGIGNRFENNPLFAVERLGVLVPILWLKMLTLIAATLHCLVDCAGSNINWIQHRTVLKDW